MKVKDTWNSQLGIILAVAGSAVGLGNFVRFPGNAAQFGGGAFMLAYFVSLVILGLPIAWMEWTFGRYGGQRGFSSPPGILTTIWKHPLAKYVGAIAAVTTISLYSYYSYVEAWCLGYSVNFLSGKLHFREMADAKDFFAGFLGLTEDGAGIHWGTSKIWMFIVFVTLLNFTLVYRGISRGIEKFAKIAIPTLMVLALIILIRVLTLGAPVQGMPQQNVSNGLGFMWNPNKTFLYENTNQSERGAEAKWVKRDELVGANSLENARVLERAQPDRYKVETVLFVTQLKSPKLWLAAASQVFFSLAVGFGAIMVYASYMKRDDDLVLSSLTAVSANEFAEVCLGGLMTLPAAYAFLGAAGIVGQGIFELAFNVLPMVFTMMPLGNLFGFVFFGLLFIASISGVLCMLQSGIAFFEETLSIDRKRAVVVVFFLNMLSCVMVFWFSKDLKAMATFDFWIGNFMVFTVSMINIILFGWVFGKDKIFDEAHRGAAVKIPNFFIPIIKYICPVFLITIFLMWIVFDVIGLGQSGVDSHIVDLFGDANGNGISKVAWLTVGNILFMCTLTCLIVSRVKKYKDLLKSG